MTTTAKLTEALRRIEKYRILRDGVKVTRKEQDVHSEWLKAHIEEHGNIEDPETGEVLATLQNPTRADVYDIESMDPNEVLFLWNKGCLKVDTGQVKGLPDSASKAQVEKRRMPGAPMAPKLVVP